MGTQFEGRTALVTGAGRGIGRELARQLAAEGARVAVLARSHAELTETARQVRVDGGQAHVVLADVADAGQRAEALRQVREAYGPVDILVNNAAVVAPLEPSAELDPADWAAAIELNLTAAAALTFALLPAMLDRGWGRVVNVSSGVVAQPGFLVGGNAYVTSKAALEAHTLNLAAELNGTGVTANVYRPGAVDTAMQAVIRGTDPERLGAGLRDHFARTHERGELLTPAASARSMLARLGGDATGQLWHVADPI
jgi:NAD(P)-dependent dehydrogenase (short-subunit alcohol dehydrogenase family)